MVPISAISYFILLNIIEVELHEEMKDEFKSELSDKMDKWMVSELKMSKEVDIQFDLSRPTEGELKTLS